MKLDRFLSFLPPYGRISRAASLVWCHRAGAGCTLGRYQPTLKSNRRSKVSALIALVICYIGIDICVYQGPFADAVLLSSILCFHSYQSIQRQSSIAGVAAARCSYPGSTAGADTTSSNHLSICLSLVQLQDGQHPKGTLHLFLLDSRSDGLAGRAAAFVDNC